MWKAPSVPSRRHRSALSQTRIEGQSEQSDISLLNPAVPPIQPAGPKVLLNTVLALFLGTLLGVGVALLAEMLDRRVRSETDLSDALQLPVLGSIDWNAPARAWNRFWSLLPRSLRLN